MVAADGGDLALDQPRDDVVRAWAVVDEVARADDPVAPERINLAQGVV